MSTLVLLIGNQFFQGWISGHETVVPSTASKELHAFYSGNFFGHIDNVSSENSFPEISLFIGPVTNLSLSLRPQSTETSFDFFSGLFLHFLLSIFPFGERDFQSFIGVVIIAKIGEIASTLESNGLTPIVLFLAVQIDILLSYNVGVGFV